MSASSAGTNGIKGRCPKCGEGALFSGILKFVERCNACDTDFSRKPISHSFVLIVQPIVVFAMPLFPLYSLASKMETKEIIIYLIVAYILAIGLLRVARGHMFDILWSDARDRERRAANKSAVAQNKAPSSQNKKP